ncbi:unnamed protein product [Phytophthora fragariaefolia]|uniref:Unnamed protein product n=1 Tax=Phytophthora fragariaefolia TaxID=1490495 RepID=A0A9W7CR96_9STRA|nr:unnamed protein product [Phytophthora fragariaefolia]
MAARQVGHQREIATQFAWRLKATQAYGAHEILHVIGLLAARMLCPQKRCFAAHWFMVEDGTIPAGLFGQYMTCDRWQNILRDLHLVDNTIVHGRDKLWKLRPVVDPIQERFLAGWSLPDLFSFDEGLAANANISLCRNCSRFEVYAGKRDTADAGSNGIDFKTGAAAVLRNLKAVFTPQSRHN